MSTGYCEHCGDASGERHLCIPPFLDRAPSATHIESFLEGAG